MNLPFSAIAFAPSYRRVADAIAARIVDRSLQAGDALPTETTLALQLGVNRSTLREALRDLESRGLLERRRGSKRLVVTHPATQAVAERISNALTLQQVTIAELWETLMLLEPPAADVAARRCHKSDIELLQTAAERFVAEGADTAAAVAAVAAFFRALIAATGNRALALAHEPALQLLQLSLQLMIDRVPQARARIRDAHRKLIGALSNADAAAASSWMEKHIRDFRRGFELAGINLGSPASGPLSTAPVASG